MAGSDSLRGRPGQPGRPAAPAADGLVVRAAEAAEAAAVARIYVECWRAGYHGILPAAFAERLNIDDQSEIWRSAIRTPGNATLLAVNPAGEAVGFLCGGPERSGSTAFFAEIYGLYVLPEHRGQRVGQRLFTRFCATLAAIGLRTLLARALEANPVGSYYEFLGATEQEQRLVRVAGRSLNEIAYGWRDILPASRGKVAGDRA